MADQAKCPRAQVPVSKQVPACSYMRLGKSLTPQTKRVSATLSRTAALRWGWTTTSSVLSAIVATQAARQDLATVGLGPRGPPSDSDAAGATVTPRSLLPGNASAREVLGRLARHSVRPGACAKRAAWWLGTFCFNALDALV